MQIEVIAIGDEILSGMTVNSNAAYIGKRLMDAGYKVTRQTTLSDTPEVLKAGLKEALERSSIVITTGGLGPTCDDLTRGVAAELFDSPFHLDAKVAEDLSRRFGDSPISLEDQATIPSKAIPFLNTVGTAPGLAFTDEKHSLLLLPGVPTEMRAMFDVSILPYIEAKHPLKKKFFQKWLNFSLLTESQVDPVLRELEKEFPEVCFGIYPAYGTISISLTSFHEEMLEMPADRIFAAFKERAFFSPSREIDEAVHLEMQNRKKTLALAESITGGSMAAHLTAHAGASHYFLGSIVAYSNELKTSLLGVSHATLEKEGAVSRGAALEMLEGVFRLTNADYAIAVTGIAGPTGATPGKPVGTVWGAVGARGKDPFVETFHRRGQRDTVIIYSMRRLFANLLTYMRDE